jgi:methyl-accepting chemotaxis protein
VVTGLLGGAVHALKKAKFDKPSSGNAVGSRLSLAAKLYSIFGLFAVLTAAITILSDYNTRRNAELTEAIETASRSALNVERVNSLVYAVVMESRGIYMSTEPAVVKKYGDGAYQVQRPNPCGRQGMGIHRPGR